MRINIARLAEIFECSVVTIRTWERKGIIPEPQRSLTNRRMYSEEDVRTIRRLVDKHNSERKYPLVTKDRSA